MREQSLYSPQHQLNRTEAWDRLEYCLNYSKTGNEKCNLSVIVILVYLLRKDEEERFPAKDWQYEVANGDTKLGYTYWLQHRLESEEENAAKPFEDPDLLNLEDVDYYQEEDSWDDWDLPV